MFFTDKFDQKNANHFHLGAVSGLITGVTAAGVILAWRWPKASPYVQFMTAIHAKWRTVTGFTDAQELAIEIVPVTDFDEANYTGGTNLSDPAAPAYVSRNTPHSVVNQIDSKLETGNVSIADTGALTHAGTPVFSAARIGWDAYSELDDGATVPKGFAEVLWTPPDGKAWPIGEDAGFVVRMPVGMGAAGTGRLAIGVDFAETP